MGSKKSYILTSRAKIFQPFDALTGLREAIQKKEMELHIVEPPELCDDKAEELNQLLKDLHHGEIITVVYRAGDGLCHEKQGAFSGYDEYTKTIGIIKDRITITDIFDIKLM